PATATYALSLHDALPIFAGHPGIDHLSFTGSVATGTSVMRAAARRITPVTLELGGKSPQIVFADADLEQALATTVRAILQNAGQDRKSTRLNSSHVKISY